MRMMRVLPEWVSELVEFASVYSILEDSFCFIRARTKLFWKPPFRSRMLPSWLPLSKTPLPIRTRLRPERNLRNRSLILKRKSHANKPSVQLPVIAPVSKEYSSESRPLRLPIRAHLSLEKPTQGTNSSPPRFMVSLHEAIIVLLPRPARPFRRGCLKANSLDAKKAHFAERSIWKSVESSWRTGELSL